MRVCSIASRVRTAPRKAWDWRDGLVAGMMAIGALASPAVADPDSLRVPADTTSCLGLFGHADDPDPAGLNLRAGPSLQAPVLGTLRLHAFARDAMGRDLLQAPQFRIMGSHGGWLLVTDFSYPDAPDDPALPSGAGWVHGSRVRVETYDEPAPTARLFARAGGEGASLTIGANAFSVLGCQDRWLNVRARDGTLEGWLAAPDVCNAQMTRARVVNPCVGRR